MGAVLLPIGCSLPHPHLILTILGWTVCAHVPIGTYGGSKQTLRASLSVDLFPPELALNTQTLKVSVPKCPGKAVTDVHYLIQGTGASWDLKCLALMAWC